GSYPSGHTAYGTLLALVLSQARPERAQELARRGWEFGQSRVIASIMGENEQQWQELARLVEEAGADMIECNFSCPQMTSHAMG
ncbi:hypothetical protein MJL33_34800, partial [Salmonella enterica subsp. enterica serovar Kentucky]|nr:hypothetical protein [Salmonella enterica subsp. enterica serovar Kentucky]